MGIRTFIGIALGTHMRETLIECGDRIRHAAVSWRGQKWVSAENLHLTLAFLGTLPEDAIDEVARLASEACTSTAVYTVSLGELAAVPRLRTARMIWSSIDAGAVETSMLANALAEKLSAVGYEPPDRAFDPHITLVRARDPQPLPFEAIDAANRLLFATDERDSAMSVRGITVYSSMLTPRGPVYDELAFLSFPG
ncbi:MAG: RNA 2',3'-cyclic phosphodiesterase [Coriobacteriia bacterium]